MQILKAAVLYFAVVFGAGFVLGAICILWVAPRCPTDSMPVKLLSYPPCRFAPPFSTQELLSMQ